MLNDLWRDIISIGGFALTALGLVYAIAQIRKTTSAAKAAEEAAKQGLAESQKNFRKYATLFAHRYVNEVKLHVQNEDWAKAAMRVRDLADQMAQIANDTVAKLRDLAVEFDRFVIGELRKPSRKKWMDLLADVEAQIDEFIKPFEQNARSGS